MPWVLTQSMPSCASRRSSERRRTVWMPGRTRVPLPVTILKPRLSPTPSTSACSRSPEMTSASFGSATRHMRRNRMNSTMRATSTLPPMMMGSMTMQPPSQPLQRADHDSPGREVLDDDHPPAGLDGVVALGGVGVERLAASADRDHDLTNPARCDGAGHPPHPPDHLVCGQPVLVSPRVLRMLRARSHIMNHPCDQLFLRSQVVDNRQANDSPRTRPWRPAGGGPLGPRPIRAVRRRAQGAVLRPARPRPPGPGRARRRPRLRDRRAHRRAAPAGPGGRDARARQLGRHARARAGGGRRRSRLPAGRRRRLRCAGGAWRPGTLGPHLLERRDAMGAGPPAAAGAPRRHALAGREHVIEWARGTLLTDYQRRMPPALFEEFLADYRERLLPRLDQRRPYFYPFKRILFWAAGPADRAAPWS